MCFRFFIIAYTFFGSLFFVCRSDSVVAAPVCHEVLKLIHAIADSKEMGEDREVSLAEIFEAFSNGITPNLSNREQRLAFEAYLKMQFGSPQVNISQPQREDPVDLVRDFQQKYPQIKKPKFLSLILDSRPVVASQTEAESLSFLREHLSRLKQLQAKFLNVEANLGFWKSLFDAKDLSNQEFFLELENILHPISIAQLKNVDRFDSALVTHLFRALERRVETLAKTDDRSKKIERALVDLVHFSSLLNPGLISALEEKNDELVLRNIERALRDRDELSKSLGFETGFEGLLSSFQVKQPSGLESNESLESFVRNLKLRLDQSGVKSNPSSRRLRQLSLIESPFRSCVGNDCSSRESFSEAFDPNYVYFTVTDEKNRSSGLFTIVLGEALFQGKTIRVAFLDKIQNLNISDLEIALDALRETLAADGIRLIAATDLGDHNGISNDESIKYFLRSNDWLSEASLQAFQPHHHSYSFKHVHTRARKTFDWRFVEPMRMGKTFSVYEATANQRIFTNDFEFDQALKPLFMLKSSSHLEDQMRYIPIMQSLAHAKVAIDSQFHETLEAWIKSPEASFKLKKQAMIYWLQEDKNEFFEKLKFLNENEQLDLIQNLLETPRYRAYLFQNQNEWSSLLYQFKSNKALVEQLLKGIEIEDANAYRSWLQNEEIRESDFLSLLRFRTMGTSFLTREELEAVKRRVGLAAIFGDLSRLDKEGNASIHKAADFANSELFEFVVSEFSDENLLSLLRLSQKDGKKTIHLLAGSIRTESFEALILKKPPEFWRDLLLEAENNELGRRTIHFLSEKNQISLLELIASKLSENDFLTVLQAQDLGSNQSLHFAARMGNTDFFEWVKAQVGGEQMRALLAAKNFENKNVAETAARYMRSSLIHWIHDSL